MKNKQITMKIKLDDSKIRNEMHFNAQLKNRMHIFDDKTKFKRSREKKVIHNIKKEYM